MLFKRMSDTCNNTNAMFFEQGCLRVLALDVRAPVAVMSLQRKWE